MQVKNKTQIESFAQLLMDSNPQYIFWKDVNGHYLGCNKLYADFCNLESTEAIIGTNDGDYFNKSEASTCGSADKAVMAKGDSLLNFEEYITDYKNVGRWFNINKIPLKDKAGVVVGVLGTMTDITEIKNKNKLIEKQSITLKKQLAELQSKNKELEEFNYIVAHDLQEPIRNIHNFGGLISKTQKYDEESMSHILTNSKRMSSLLDALLSYYVMGTQEKEKEEVDLNKLVNNTTTLLDAKYSEFEYKVTIESLPTIEGYKEELVSLFQNIMSNSIKYRDPERDCHIQIFTKEETDKTVKICIEDNGIGIEKEYIEKALRIFQRLHQKDCIEGTGIGLSICSKVMKLHDGKMELLSAKDKGTQVILTFNKQLA